MFDSSKYCPVFIRFYLFIYFVFIFIKRIQIIKSVNIIPR